VLWVYLLISYEFTARLNFLKFVSLSAFIFGFARYDGSVLRTQYQGAGFINVLDYSWGGFIRAISLNG